MEVDLCFGNGMVGAETESAGSHLGTDVKVGSVVTEIDGLRHFSHRND